MNTNRSDPLPPSCDEKARLSNLHALAEWDYNRAIQQLTIRLGVLKTPNFEELHDFVESARRPMDKARAALDALPPEVRLFDPRAALDGGRDGLDCYRAIAAAAATLLAPRGILIVELGAGQAEPVAGLTAAAGLAPLTVRPDLSGVPRALVAESSL